MPWKPEYAANRLAKAAVDPEYAERRKQQAKSRTPGENREYMRAYYAANKDKWNKRTPEQQAEYNRQRRERYAADAEYREQQKAIVRSGCKVAKRNSRLKAQYGITVEQYAELERRQNGCCALCSRSPGELDGRRLAVDHCHETGAVRGLLCGDCNRALGLFRDRRDVLDRAIEYLTEARSMGDLVPPK